MGKPISCAKIITVGSDPTNCCGPWNCYPKPSRMKRRNGRTGNYFREAVMKKALRWALPLMLIVGSGASLAQSVNSGDIRGTVTDSTGAVIPQVGVTVLNVDTGVSKEFFTNPQGIYDTSSLVTGNYKVTFKREGFEELERGPITLEVGFTTINAQLKVGS